MNTTQIIGAQGEEIAQKYVQNIGYKLHSTNVRLCHDEIDIIAFDPHDRTLVFIEVKSRARRSAYHPLLNITPRKKRALLRATRAWVDQHSYEGGYRIDVLCIENQRVIDHIQQIECQ